MSSRRTVARFVRVCPPVPRAFGLCCILVFCGDLWMVAVVAMWLVHCEAARHAGGTMVPAWVLLKAGAGGCDCLCVRTMLLCGLCSLCCSLGLDCFAFVLLYGCFYGLDYVVILCVCLCLLL
jgi:hypothetical protein